MQIVVETPNLTCQSQEYYESANIIIDARSITVTLLKTVLQPYFDKNTL